MRNDAVRQHIILDEYEHLIPPWELANEIRPGSIMLVVAAIWEVNRPIVGSKEGYFERVSERMYYFVVFPLKSTICSITSLGADGRRS